MYLFVLSSYQNHHHGNLEWACADNCRCESHTR